MSNDDRDYPISTAPSDTEQQLDLDQDTLGSVAAHAPRREPQLSGFDDDDEYEEPDRDTDFATVYTEEDEAEEDYFEEDAGDGTYSEEVTANTSIWSFTEDGEDQWSRPEEPESDEREGLPVGEDTESQISLPPSAREEEYEWQEDDYLEEGESTAQWPLGMIIVGVVALLLLAAGGYGVIQQRSAMEEEIRQLQASLATAANPEEVAASRAALEEAEQRNAELKSSMDALALDNKRLTDTVTGLEAQLLAQKEALSKQTAPAKPAPAPAAAKKTEPARTPPESKPVAAPAASTGWFVNFGSYARRDTAEAWAARLKPDAGNVVVTTGSKDGKTLYRVRVVALADRQEAQSIARTLEKEYDLSKLWVGQQ